MDIKGGVYIATMESVNGRLKIGFTDRTTVEGCEERIKEWQQGTGVPGRAQLEYAVLVSSDPQRVESTVHRTLKSYRVDHNRRSEWFQIDIEPAIKALLEASGKSLVSEYLNPKSVLTSVHATNLLRKQVEKKRSEIKKLETERQAIELEEQKERERLRKEHEDYLSSPEHRTYLNQKKIYENRRNCSRNYKGIGGAVWFFSMFGSLIPDLIGLDINKWVFMAIFAASLLAIGYLLDKWVESANTYRVLGKH